MRAPKPLLVFDGDCGFCRLWIERWRAATDSRRFRRPRSRKPSI
jgi:predicted DCC family thiol-disulfide oxidoreductase YuxK